MQLFLLAKQQGSKKFILFCLFLMVIISFMILVFHSKYL